MTEKDIEIQSLCRDKARLEARFKELEQIIKDQNRQIDYQRSTIDFLMSVEGPINEITNKVGK